MKRTFFLIACALASITMQAQDELAVEDIQNSGCLAMTRGTDSQRVPTIVLTKEGSILSVQVLNYESNCATAGFNVTSTMSGGSDSTPYSVNISVVPYFDIEADCTCPYNVSFTVHDVEANSFYLNCWWYQGLVTLEDGEPLVLEDITLYATIDGVNYTLKKTLGTATLTKVVEQKSVMRIPVELDYEGQTYAVKTIVNNSFRDCTTIKKLDIPKSVSTIHSYSFYGCKLDTLIIRGFLESRYINSDLVYGLGTDMKVFVQPSEVEKYKAIYEGPVYPLTGQTPDAQEGSGLNLTDEEQTLVQGCNSFAFRLFNQTRGDEDMVLSPLSVTYALSLLNNGAAGQTRQEISEVLGFGSDADLDAVNAFCHKMMETSDTLDPQTRMQLANAVFVNEPYHLLPSFKEIAEQYYNAWVESRDFADGQTRDVINQWGCDHTNGMIPEILDSLTFRPLLTTSYLLNAVWFKGLWRLKFDPSKTTEEAFGSSGTMVPMMHMTDFLYYNQNAVCQALRMPYGNEAFGMTIFLPREGKTIDDVLSLLAEQWPGSFGDDSWWEIDAKVPRMDITTRLPLNDAMKSLGMNLAFDVKLAEFPYFCDQGTYVGLLKQDARLKMDEEGTEASAITTAIILPMGDPITPIDFHANRPFLYVISEKSSGLIYFIGQMTGISPSKEQEAQPEEEIAYRPFVEDGKVWKVGGVGSNPVQWVEYYYFEGDTIIDGKSCKQMMRQQYNPDIADISQYPLPGEYVGAWYEEDKQVYEYDSIIHQFMLMYDFSVGANDTLLIDNLPYVIGPRQTGDMDGFKGVYRDVMLCVDSIYSTPWLEGVGSIDRPTTNVYPGCVDPMWFLMSCTVGDEVIYLNDEYEDGATPDVMGVKNRFDFTHTIKTKPKAPMMREKSDACISSSEREVSRPKVKAPMMREKSDACISSSEREVSRPMVKAPMKRGTESPLYGEYNDLLLDINLAPLDDAYLVRITDESGKAVYEKDINAGIIVGLNIDISAYAEGRYTVTVENSQEVFTGEFGTQTTGIEDIDLTPALSQEEEAIYNLQGQRISSLRKGLNIVNGQKVYVK